MMSYIILALFLSIGVQATDSYMYVFAQEWPGSVCKFEKCKAENMGNFDAQRWNVHGFWPNTVNSTFCGQITSCRSEAFDPELIFPNTYELLDITWNGLYSDTQTFRGYEWGKHGTCYPGPVEQNYYFSLVGSMAIKYNFYEILAQSGIYPDDSNPITDSQVRNAFALAVGADSKVTYSCLKDASTGNLYIGQMKVCFNNSLQPRTCNCSKPLLDASFVSCGNLFYYPTYKQVQQ